MPRFVILEHTDSPRTPGRVHWDLLLEPPATSAGSPLRTWELAAFPTAGVVVDALALPDHRALYLDYEGVLSDGRGALRRVCGGSFLALATSNQRWVVRLESPELSGTIELVRSTPDGQRWRASFREF